MNKPLKPLKIYSSKTRETQPFTFKQVLQLRDGIEITKSQNRFSSSQLHFILNNLNQKISLN